MNQTRMPGQGHKIAFHSPCHLGRGLGVKEDPRQLIARPGNIYLKTREEETCCGFGGSFSVNFPAVSREILTRKLADVEAAGADLLVTECPGCVMQLRGGAVQQGRNIRVMHLFELFPPPPKARTEQIIFRTKRLRDSADKALGAFAALCESR